MGFKFIKTRNPENNYDTTEISFELPHEIEWPEVLGAFESFLRACGYSLPDNAYLDFVDIKELRREDILSER